MPEHTVGGAALTEMLLTGMAANACTSRGESTSSVAPWPVYSNLPKEKTRPAVVSTHLLMCVCAQARAGVSVAAHASAPEAASAECGEGTCGEHAVAGVKQLCQTLAPHLQSGDWRYTHRRLWPAKNNKTSCVQAVTQRSPYAERGWRANREHACFSPASEGACRLHILC
jgi:hypothetical protein